MAKERIDFLDLIGGDPDFENELLDDDSEELEDADPAEDDGTVEPSLAALERPPSQSSPGRDRVGDQTDWAADNRDDREDEHDGAEPDEDDEPSLGWTDHETIFGNYAGTFGVDNEVDDYEGRVA